MRLIPLLVLVSVVAPASKAATLVFDNQFGVSGSEADAMAGGKGNIFVNKWNPSGT